MSAPIRPWSKATHWEAVFTSDPSRTFVAYAYIARAEKPLDRETPYVWWVEPDGGTRGVDGTARTLTEAKGKCARAWDEMLARRRAALGGGL